MTARLARTWRRYGVRWLLGVLLTFGAMAQIAGVADSDTVDRFDTFIDGLRMRLAPPVLDGRIVIVDIDEDSLARVGRWPWNRDVVARLTRKLTVDYGARAVGYDVVFAEPDVSSGYPVLAALAQGELRDVPGFAARLAQLQPALDYDGLLAGALQGQPVVLGYNVSATQKKGQLPAPAFTVEELNGREIDALAVDGYEANLDRLQSAARGAGIFTATVQDAVLRLAALPPLRDESTSLSVPTPF